VLQAASTVLGVLYNVACGRVILSAADAECAPALDGGHHGRLPLLNCLEFHAYLVSNLAFYYSDVVRAQCGPHLQGFAPTVRFNETTFAPHGLLSLVTLLTRNGSYFTR
jgi:cystinosin